MMAVICLLNLFYATHAFSQTSETQVEYSEEIKEDSDFKEGRRYKYFSRDLVEEKFQLRFGVQSLNYSPSPGYPYSRFFLGAEYKFTKSNSVMANLYRSGTFLGNGYEFALRHYYNKKKKIEEGLSANNMNGGYVSIGYEGLRQRLGNVQLNSNILKAHWGVQQRLGRLGFFGFNLGLDYVIQNDPFDTGASDYLTFASQARVGLALGYKPVRQRQLNQNMQNHRLLNPPSRLKDEKGLFKVGLDNLNIGQDVLGFSVGINYEHKIWPSFSIYGGAGGYYVRRSNLSIPNPNDPSFEPLSSFTDRGYDFHFGAKYYYGMKSQIEKGLSGNNFSGNYVGFEIDRLFGRQEISDFRSFRTRPSYSVFWGTQRRVGSAGFIELNTGLQYYSYRPNYFDSQHTSALQPFIRLNFGLGL